MTTPTAEVAHVMDTLETLAGFNADPAAGGVTREVYTPEYMAAMDYVEERMRAAGLETRRDAFGNLWGRWVGGVPGVPAVVTGSHFDTTLNAGKYDGVVGVLGGIEAVRRLRESGVRSRRTIEVVAFAGEEPRFGVGCIGSRAVMGELSRADLDTLRDRDGISIADALRGAGLDPDRLDHARIDAAGVHAFVELHVEQGAVLEAAGLPIGVVTRIAAPHSLRVLIGGRAMHSGATAMDLRRDALVGAAEAVVEVERLARASASGTTVGTVGVLRVAPGAINVIPGTVEMEIDIRDSDLAAREAVVAGLHAALTRICERRGLELEVGTIAAHEPATCSAEVIAAASDACKELGVPYREMMSGAYHDAMVLGAAIPMGMVFVPSVGGVSHSPLEHTEAQDIARGIEVLAGVLERLAR